MVTGYSEEISTPAELAPAWSKVRGDILEANGLDRGTPNVRLSPGCIVLDVKMPAGHWIAVTDDGQAEYRWRLSLNTKTDTPATYRLRSAGKPR